MKIWTVNISQGKLNEYTDRQGADRSPRCPICGENIPGPQAWYIDNCISPFCCTECADIAARGAETDAENATSSF